MRTIATSHGPMEVRPLTRKEIRGGREHGMGHISFDLTPANYDAALDYTLALLFAEDVLDPLSNQDINNLFLGVIKETWGDPGEEKNLSTSGPGDQTDDVKTPAAAA
jgi:hypothetical protein